MNDAKLQLDAGNLTGAVEAALRLVKTNPTNQAARTFLFELSCFSGDWERAEKQLDVIGHQDANAMIGSIIYKQNFLAERNRMKLFSDGLRPEFLGPEPPHIGTLFDVSLVKIDGTEKREMIIKPSLIGLKTVSEYFDIIGLKLPMICEPLE